MLGAGRLNSMTTTRAATTADELTAIMLADDVAASLWIALEAGRLEALVPELPALRMEQDPIHKHKDVLTHTIAVVSKTGSDLRVRLAALFHDIAKPRTRSYEHGGVTFRHHEVVGAKMTRKRLTALGYPDDVVRDVADLVRLSGRFKGYGDGWSDSAVRRYARGRGTSLGSAQRTGALRLHHPQQDPCDQPSSRDRRARATHPRTRRRRSAGRRAPWSRWPRSDATTRHRPRP